MRGNIELELDIFDVVIKRMQDSFANKGYIKFENILEKHAQDNFNNALYIEQSYSIRFKRFIQIIDHKYYITNHQNKVDNSEQSS